MRKKKLLEHPVRMFREEELSKLPKDKGKPVVIAELFSPGENGPCPECIRTEDIGTVELYAFLPYFPVQCDLSYAGY